MDGCCTTSRFQYYNITISQYQYQNINIMISISQYQTGREEGVTKDEGEMDSCCTISQYHYHNININITISNINITISIGGRGVTEDGWLLHNIKISISRYHNISI